MTTWIGISLVICAVALLRWVQARAARGGRGAPSSAQMDRMEGRLKELERRLGDVQEVILSIDERLERRDAAVGSRLQ